MGSKRDGERGAKQRDGGGEREAKERVGRCVLVAEEPTFLGGLDVITNNHWEGRPYIAITATIRDCPQFNHTRSGRRGKGAAPDALPLSLK